MQKSSLSHSINPQVGTLLADPPSSADWFTGNNNPKIAWATRVLGLELDPNWDSKTRGGQVLARFFAGLEADDFSLDLRRLAAVKILLGNVSNGSPELKYFQEELAKEQLKQIEKVTHWYASRLGAVDQGSLFDELKTQLQPYFHPETMPAVRSAAEQVFWVAEATEAPRAGDTPLVRQLLRAVFQVMATRPARLQSVQRTLLSNLRKQIAQKERVAAAKVLMSTYRLPNGPNLHRFFRQLTWSRHETTNFEIELPRDSTPLRTSSGNSETKEFNLKPYLLVFGTVASFFAALFVFTLIALRKPRNSPSNSPPIFFSVQKSIDEASKNSVNYGVNPQGKANAIPTDPIMPGRNPLEIDPIFSEHNQRSNDPFEEVVRMREKLMNREMPKLGPPNLRRLEPPRFPQLRVPQPYNLND